MVAVSTNVEFSLYVIGQDSQDLQLQGGKPEAQSMMQAVGHSCVDTDVDHICTELCDTCIGSWTPAEVQPLKSYANNAAGAWELTYSRTMLRGEVTLIRSGH